MKDSENWEKAVSEFREYLEHNPEVKSQLYKTASYNANILNNPQVQKGFGTPEVDEDLALSDSAMKFFVDTVYYINHNFNDGWTSEVDFNHFIDEHIKLLNELSDALETEKLSLKQSFRDIALSDHRTPQEAIIYDTAKEFLEPSDFSRAIAQDLPVSEVLSEIEQSRIHQFIKIFASEEYQKERRENVEEAQAELENPLSANLSYTNALEREFAKDASLNDISPDATPEMGNDKKASKLR